MPFNFTHCAALVRESDRDRYLATLFAPAETRDALFALYAFDVEISRVRDLAREAMAGEIRLQWWREALSGERDGEAAAHPVAAAVIGTLARYRIGADRLVALIDAHQFDLYETPMATRDELDNYALRTESVLLVLAAELLGCRAENVGALARHAGIAYAVTGVLSHLARHAARRQLFVPEEVLARHAVAREDVYAQRDSEALMQALADLRRHALEHLAAARAELDTAPIEIMPALLPLAVIGPTLRRMERRSYAPFAFEPLSPWRRQWLIWRASHNPAGIFE